MTGEIPVFNLMASAAFGLLVLVTGGVAYLTAVEWRDRRRRKADAAPRPGGMGMAKSKPSAKAAKRANKASKKR
jgi:hypothetical protein